MQGNDHAYHDESVACQTPSWSVRLTPQPWRKVEEDVLCQEKFRLEVAYTAPHASAGGFNFVPILQKNLKKIFKFVFFGFFSPSTPGRSRGLKR